MTTNKATITQSLLIVGGFVILALIVAGIVESKVKGIGEHESHMAGVPVIPVDVQRQPSLPLAVMVAKPETGVKERTLQEFYARRAYPGAPPMIPHEVANDGVISDDCLSCHKDGGYAPKYNAYSPVTPHPEQSNCRQCHVPAALGAMFVDTGWYTLPPPARGRSKLPGSPPPIPHGLQLRENCQACHVGPGAVREIRVSHPERENCEQCHVPCVAPTIFATPYPVGKPADDTN